MKHYERRQLQAFPYYKLATWDARSMTFRDGKVAYATRADATKSAKKPGRYRLSIVTEDGRSDLESFDL